MAPSNETTAPVWQVWHRRPGETTWRAYATFPFQVQADTMSRRITERMGDETKVERAPRA
jgi:hypothetical protein